MHHATSCTVGDRWSIWQLGVVSCRELKSACRPKHAPRILHGNSPNLSRRASASDGVDGTEYSTALATSTQLLERSYASSMQLDTQLRALYGLIELCMIV